MNDQRTQTSKDRDIDMQDNAEAADEESEEQVAQEDVDEDAEDLG